MKERKIGDIFEEDGVKLEIKKSSRYECGKRYYLGKPISVCKTLDCTDVEGKSVNFVRVKEE
jgi:hypothetical protein